MARAEHDRDDLLREATALVERVELQVAESAEPIVAGFRRDGACSLFFGGDPVYQFNSAGALRRAFVAGLLYKAEEGRLVVLRRERTTAETALVRRLLGDQEKAALLSELAQRLASLRRALAAQQFTIRGQVPAGHDILERVRQWLAALPATLVVARKPHAE